MTSESNSEFPGTLAQRPQCLDIEVSALDLNLDRCEEGIWHLLHHITASMRRLAGRRLAVHGITEAQCILLAQIKMRGPTRITALAQAVRMSTGSMTRLLDRMERKGLCERVRLNDDRRVVHIKITSLGEAAIKDACSVLTRTEGAHLTGLADSELLLLHRYLGRIRANAQHPNSQTDGA